MQDGHNVHVPVLLADAEEGRGGRVGERLRAHPQSQPSPFGDGELRGRPPQRRPPQVGRQDQPGAGIGGGGPRSGEGHLDQRRYPTVPGGEHGPAVLPHHRHEERLAAEVVVVAAVGAHAEQHGPPAAVGGLDEVGVADSDDVDPAAEVPVGQDRVGTVALVRTGHRVRPRNGHRVVELGATLGREQVVGAVDLVQVRPLRPDDTEHRAVPQDVLRPDQRLSGRVELAQPHLGLVVPLRHGGQPGAVHPDVPSSSKKIDGSMPSTSSQTGSDHGPAGSVAVIRKLPPRASSLGRRACRPARRGRRGGAASARRGRRRTRCRRSRAGRPGDDVPDLLPARRGRCCGRPADRAGTRRSSVTR